MASACCRELIILLICTFAASENVRNDTVPEIYSLHIRSDIAYRFATTTVVSRLANHALESKEAVFLVQLPESAFISNFSMTIEGKVYDGQVKEKEQAKKEYTKAKSRGQTAGHVSAKPRETNRFKVAVNVAAQSKITFNITFQELLQRKLGLYEHVINVNPGQVVRDLKVDVYIHESREITVLKVPPLRVPGETNNLEATQNNELAVIDRIAPNKAHISYRPSAAEQQADSSAGISGQFVVQYDVKRDMDAGELQVVNGYFVHYFAPTGLPVVNKNVFFILDVSGSMSGRKIRQVKDAMNVILNDLREDDYFNIILFGSGVRYWNDENMIQATLDHVGAAKQFVRRMSASGGTNINDALVRGMEFLERHESQSGKKLPSLIIFLTDGDPTSGETSLEKIESNVKAVNKERYSLFSLAFGSGADYKFLQKLSLQNRGVARKIYEDSDADLQLKGFYDEVANPLLSDIKVEYLGDSVDNTSLTRNAFINYFDGSEIVVAGKLADVNVPSLSTRISGVGAEGNVLLDTNVIITGGVGNTLDLDLDAPDASSLTSFTERLWAYLTIKNTLETMKETSDNQEKETLKQKALDMSLKYHFVTPVTSMLVVKPDEPEKNAGDLIEDDGSEAESSASKSRGPSRKMVHSASVQRSSGSPGFSGFADIRQFRRLDHFNLMHARLPPPMPTFLSLPRPSFLLPATITTTTTTTTTTHTPYTTKRQHKAGTSGRKRKNKKKVKEALSDNDPHFLITVKGSNKPVCFDVNGNPGDLYQLLWDPDSDITVNAKIVARKGSTKTWNKTKTYFGAIGFLHGNTRVKVGPHSIKINDKTYNWRQNTVISTTDGVKVTIHKKRNVTIGVGNGKEFAIVRHRVKRNHPTKVSFVGFYILSGDGLSSRSHGLIGQFFHRAVNIQSPTASPASASNPALLTFQGRFRKRPVEVRPGRRLNMRTSKHVDCWHVRNNGWGFIDGHFENYKVKDILREDLAIDLQQFKT
ncbi:inter-alpha-trypsin inhibitor heavy chain H3 isoform X1 [Lingula anatina]|uniref:Inter-alpha-trypsin inhibitor heavy chain H3 isoform X1 n=1 Tax=Lingula anatina TaxID=7574 RepID=A0A1S3JCZ5_LINAN|nr:inter-alpha-trypsin inhibitor heavy chain H3 isoform X1 [Lingula anatina]|eukprot:XP_013407759.1 inter-alpha-trypsin inhibitor heavy chain H3 isoform X1 [Lingula anatina]